MKLNLLFIIENKNLLLKHMFESKHGTKQKEEIFKITCLL